MMAGGCDGAAELTVVGCCCVVESPGGEASEG